MKLLIVGCNSVLGQVVSLYCIQHGHITDGLDLVNRYDVKFNAFYNLDIIKEGVGELSKIIKKNNYDAILNCMALLIKESEENPTDAEFINSWFPHFLEEETKTMKTVVVHRSTDCIFSGKIGNYSLKDAPDGYTIYAKTKAKGELNNKKDITIRTSLVGPDRNVDGQDLFGWFNTLKGNVNGFANSIWTGLTTIEYTKEALYLIEKKAHGLFQCVPNKAISKFELLLLFERYFPRNRRIIKINNEKNDKSLKQEIGCYGLCVPSYEKQIKEMKEWMTKQYKTNSIYSHYLED